MSTDRYTKGSVAVWVIVIIIVIAAGAFYYYSQGSGTDTDTGTPTTTSQVIDAGVEDQTGAVVEAEAEVEVTE